MARTYYLGCVLLLASSSASAGCWVIENLRGSGAYEYNQFAIKNDGFAEKVVVVNIDKKSLSVTDSIMNYTVLRPNGHDRNLCHGAGADYPDMANFHR